MKKQKQIIERKIQKNRAKETHRKRERNRSQKIERERDLKKEGERIRYVEKLE